MEPINVEVKLNNGDKHYIVFEEGKEKFFDLVRFGEGAFLQDKNKSYFAVKHIISFYFKE
jgi:hypothetical protein